MAGTSTSVSQNSSQSQSTTGVLDYPERAFLDSIAQYAGQVGSNVYNWAQGEYAKNSNLTDANIHNYLTASQGALDQAAGYQNTYNNTALPEAKHIISEGNNYASPSRRLSDMGAAESGQMQAGDAARKNAERDLQSYGVDPSAGRYASLDRAAQVSSAASAVGAAKQAQDFDVTTGQNLQQQGLNALNNATGTFQGATTNATNTALQGFAGAENAGLANANTGVALQGAASPFLNTAASYKPVTGTNSSSSSQGTSASNSQTTDPPQQQKDPSQQQQQQPSSGGGGSGGGGSGGSGSGSSQSDAPFQEGSGGTVFDTGSGVDMSGYGDNPFSSAYPTDSIGGSYDPGSDASLSSYSNGDFGDYSGYSGGGGDSGQATYDSVGGGGDLGGAYAQGGAIPDDDDTGGIPQDGGAIPQSASPSGGQMVDDVQAQGPQGGIHVNADEFVIPRDVALWKGQEFFQKLIAQSRQARVTAPAHPTRGAPAPAQNMR